MVAGTTGDVVAGTTGNAAAAAEASPSLELERGERGGGESGDRESFELVLDESPDAAAATQIAGGGSEASPSEDGEGGAGAGTQLQPMGPTGRRRRTLSSDEEDDVEDEDEAEEEEQAASASEAESEEQEEMRAEGAAAAAAPGYSADNVSAGYSAGAQRLGGGPCASEEELRQRRLQALEPSDAQEGQAEGPEAPATEPQHEPASSTAAGAAAAPTAAPSVCEWLRSAGLGDHVASFEAEKVDMLSLGMLTEADLTALGLPLGHRRRFQAYVEAGFG